MRSFNLQIVTPDGSKFTGPAEKVILRTINGDICILARHVNFVSALGMGECKVVLEGGQTKLGVCIGGMVVVADDVVRVVASAFEWSDEIDLERAKISKEKAEKALTMNLSAQEQAAMEAKLKRALLRIKSNSNR